AAAAEFSEAAAVSLLVSGSGWSAAVFTAMLVITPGRSTVASSVSVAKSPAFRRPTCHAPLVSVEVPFGGVPVTSVRPAGSTSVTTTLLAAFGPAFAACTVKVTVSPTSASDGVTLFVTDTSARVSTMVRTVAVLLVGSLSGVVLVTVAVSTIGSGIMGIG